MTASALLFLALSGCKGCNSDYELEVAAPPEVTLEVTSPLYGAFLGEEAALVTGTVYPPGTVVVIEGTPAQVDESGAFTAQIPVDGPYLIVDVEAADKRARVPVFSGRDPEETWPGGISARLLPAGLTVLGEEVGAMLDATGWAADLSAQLPSLEGDWYGLTAVGVTHDPTVVGLAGVDGGVDTAITLANVGVEYNGWVDVFGTVIEFPISIFFGEVAVSALAVPELDDAGILSLTLTDAALTLAEPDITIGVLEGWLLEWLVDLLNEWVIVPLTDLLLDTLLEEWGYFEVGGPFAFEYDLLGEPLSLELASVFGDPEGLGAGVAVGLGEPVSGDPFDVLFPGAAGAESEHLAVGVHEGLIDGMLSGELLTMLQQDLELGGTYGDIIGAGVEQLPGGDQAPEGDGWCLTLDPGTATVARMQDGTDPLAVLYIPDLVVNIGIQQGAVCEDWLVASLAAEVGLKVEEDGTTLGIDIQVPEGAVLYYGASDYDEQEVVAALGTYVGTMVSLVGGAAEINIAELLGDLSLVEGMTPIAPKIVDSEPLVEEDGTWTEGLYKVTLTLWD